MCPQVPQLPDSGPQSSADRDDLNLKAGICAFSAVLGNTERFFFFVFFSECNGNQENDQRTAQSSPC